MRSTYTDGGSLRTGRLFIRDIFLHVLILGIVVVWITFAVMLSANSDDPATPEDESWTEDTLAAYVMVFAAVTVADIVLVLVRYRSWAGLVRHGVEVPGKVTRVTQTPQGAWVDVSYVFEGRDVPSKRIIGGLLPRVGMKLSEGQEVSTLVDGRRPDRYIILDLYLKPRT